MDKEGLKTQEMNKDKEGRNLSASTEECSNSQIEQEHNKAYQHVRLMEYLNELPNANHS